MDRETVFALAREAAFHTPVFEAELIRFAALVAAHEREACAQTAQTPVHGEQDDLTMAAKDRIAAAIRSRT